MSKCDVCEEPDPDFLAFYYSGRQRELCEMHAKDAMREDDRPYKMKKHTRRSTRRFNQLKLEI